MNIPDDVPEQFIPIDVRCLFGSADELLVAILTELRGLRADLAPIRAAMTSGNAISPPGQI